MKRLLFFLIFFITFGAIVVGQDGCGPNGKLLINAITGKWDCGSAATTGSGAPSNPCPSAGRFYTDTSGNVEYFCPSNGGNWVAIAASGGAVAFSAITGATNSIAAMVCGTGCSLTISGSGTINATSLGGTPAASYALLASPTFTGVVTAPIVEHNTIAPITDGTAGIVFAKTDDTTIVGSIDTTNTRWLFGPGAAPDSLLELRGTTGAVATTAPLATTLLHISGADGAANRITMDSFAGANSILWQRADTGIGSKSACQNNDVIGGISAIGFKATVYSGGQANISMACAGAWTDSSAPTTMSFSTTPSGSTTLTTALTISTDQSLLFNGFRSGGTKFTLTGCSAGTTVGGATAGTYTSGTTGTCTVVITMGGASGITAANGWSCTANDRTTPADKQQTTASSTTTATISGTTVSGDVIDFHCVGY